MKAAADSLFKRLALALTAFAGFVLLWHAAVVLLKIHPIVLPTPLRVCQVAWDERSKLMGGFMATGQASLLGLGLSISLGSAIAILFSQSRWIRTAFYPYVVFLQTVPIVAIAPLLITWFGYGFQTVVLIATIISLFPVVSNVTTGLISVDENLTDLFRLSAASRCKTLFKLRIPYAVSHLILGTRISAGLAVIGAIVGEFFVGTGASNYAGLGTLMTGWQNLARTDALIAVVFVSTTLGLCMLGLVNFIARTLLGRWTASSGFEAD
jgi:NitT/TauT family transport system permease protein